MRASRVVEKAYLVSVSLYEAPLHLCHILSLSHPFTNTYTHILTPTGHDPPLRALPSTHPVHQEVDPCEQAGGGLSLACRQG
jgi:hypothetical protein